MTTRIGKIARTTAKVLAAALLVVVAAVVLILTTNAGLRLALRVGLPIYNGKIAGSVAIEAAEGTLLGSFTLRGVTLADREGRALITADAIALDWSPLALLGRDLAVDSLVLERPRVYLPGPGGSFADIAPPGDDVPKDMSLPPGPDLPLGIAAVLRLRDAAVYFADGAPIVEAFDLDLRARGVGRAAEAEVLAGHGRLLGSREIEELVLRARWGSPVAAVEGLRVVADAAVIQIPQAQVDVRSWRTVLDVEARAALGLLAEYLPPGSVEKLMAPAGTLELAVAAEGVPEDMSAEVRLALAPDLALRLTGAGAWRGVPAADVTVAADVDLAPWTQARLGRVRPTLELHARQMPSNKRIAVAGGLRCPECGRLGGVSLDLEGVVDPAGKNLSLATALDAAGIGALVDVTAVGGALRQVDWRLAVVDVARTAGVARQFAAVPELAGTLSGRGACVGPELRCAGALELRRVDAAGVAVERGRVDVDVLQGMSEGTVAVAVDGLRAGGQAIDRGEVRLDVEKLAPGPVAPPVPAALPPLHARLRAGARGPGSRAEVDLSVRTGQELGAELRTLTAEHAGFHAELERPARAVLSGTRLQVEDLALQIAGGRLAVGGVVDADGPSDLKVDLSGLALARLRPLVPRLRPAGLASAHVRVHGRPEAPSLEADVRVARAGLRGNTFGDLDVAARLASGRAQVDVNLRGPLARELRVRAEAPVHVDMSQRTGSIGQAYTKLDLQAREIQLARLRPWLKRPEIDGRLDGMVLFEAYTEEGPLASPRVVTEWRARGLTISGAPVGDVAVSVTHRGEWLQGKVDLHRSGGRAQLDVQVPLEFDPLHGRFAWHREREHRALLQLDDIDIADQLDAIAPGHDAGGKLTLRAEMTGPATRPALEAELHGEGLMHRRIALGSLSLVATMRDGGAAVDLSGGGGQVGRFQVRALAPVALDDSGVRWRRDGWYALMLDLRELELTPLEPLLGLNLGGRITGGVTFDGAGRHPKLRGAVRADRLSFKDQPVGALRAELEFRDGLAKVGGHGRLGKQTTIDLAGRVPIDVDLAKGEFAWATERPGKVKLDINDLDHDALEPFSPLPQQALVALDIHAQAEVDAEHVRGKTEVTGEIGHKVLGGLPLKIQLDVDDLEQSVRGSLGRRTEKGSLTFAVDTKASIPKLRAKQAKLTDAPLRGELKASATDLRYLSGFFPEAIYDFTGHFSSDVTAGGVIGKPKLRGSARLQKGGVTVVALQQRFRDLNFQIDADGPKVTLTGLTATSGEGRLKGSGGVTFSSGGKLNAEAELDLRKFPVVRPGLPQMIVDTHVRAGVKRSPAGLGVAIDVDGAEVWVSDLTTRAPDPLPENEHVKIVTGPFPELQAAVGSQAAAASDKEPPVVVAEERTMPPSKTPPTGDVEGSHLDLEVRLKQPVHIKGPSMDMNWSGALALHRKGEEAEVTGGFRADRGRFELLGNRFTIDQGRVFLPEDGSTIDPYLDLTADTTTPQAEVNVAIRGRLSRPELKLRSRPSLTEGQIFALLLTGTADTQESDPKKTQASAAGLLVNFSNPTLSRFADQKLGIDRIKFGFADDVTQPVLSVGKHLTKKIYAETTYHHNAPARTNRIEGSFEYRFKPQWSVETFFGDAAVGGLDLFWRRTFGRTGAEPKPASEPRHEPAPTPTKQTAKAATTR
ncbi:translocation/assembly module TamB domain-containing protein [Nannocystis punicea]|uniref:Translocation/assembly module TamB domain-containing protein n=1 Tax=Nannocystis punicea TaxID=2995304 RepID=A0ABY7H5A9_9BACT|nr:translocation/assembly module TamB domain-containing protein [Nannocystis poenicansa]WAS94454.1 translocation/assembly module TamB domain-containing protein [Nannocystis poenicansa]